MVKAVTLSTSYFYEISPSRSPKKGGYCGSYEGSESSNSLTPVALSTLSPEPTQSKNRVRAVANTIGDFLQRNWKYLLLYTLAWSLILICHSSVALVLSIWLGIGFGAGLILGVISANFLDKNNKYPHLNSLWNITNHGLQQLDPNGTRQVLLATIVASISALIYASPQAIGFAIGAFLGNQTSTLVVYGYRFKSGPGYIADRDLFNKQEERIRQALMQCHLIRNQMILQHHLDLLKRRSHHKSSLRISQSKTITIRPLTDRVSLPEDIGSDLLCKNPQTAISILNNKISQLNQSLAQLYDCPTRVIEQ